MNPSRLLIILLAGLTLLAPPAFSQSSASKPKASPENTAGIGNAAAKAEADRAREGRQAQARALLFTLSGEARGFRDQTLRARSLARIADALWAVAPDQGRLLFREAWEAAERADEESEGQLDLRRSVLTLAARRDQQLAEEFLKKLSAVEESKTAPSGDGSRGGGGLWELSTALEKRLSLAENLLDAGDDPILKEDFDRHLVQLKLPTQS